MKNGHEWATCGEAKDDAQANATVRSTTKELKKNKMEISRALALKSCTKNV